MRFSFVIVLACCIVGLHAATAFKPIFAMHGISSGHRDWDRFSQFVSKHHPGTVFVPLPVFEVVRSYVSLREQVDGIIRFISNITNSQPEVYGQGYHLVCHSQGALLCRCIAQEWDEHKISALLSLAGPQASARHRLLRPFSSL
jgi:palmitoyl-protein thioesterase